jgi:hypothetical protein
MNPLLRALQALGGFGSIAVVKNKPHATAHQLIYLTETTLPKN